LKDIDVIKRVFRSYIKKYIPELSLTFIFILITSAATAATAWLLDPAIKEIFENKNKLMLYVIPVAIVIAFTIKALSIFLTRIITIKVATKICSNISSIMAEKLITSDTLYITGKHSGKFISHFTWDLGVIFSTLTGVVVSLVKESITLIFLIALLFYHDWQLALVAMIMIPITAFFSKNLGKKMGKRTLDSAEKTDRFVKFLSEIIKGSLLIKIYQKEHDEIKNINQVIEDQWKAHRKTQQTFLGAAPVMETISAIAIAIVVFFAGYRSFQGALSLGEFVSFLAALMLAYQPVRALAGLNIGIKSGLVAVRRTYEIIDRINLVKEESHLPELKINRGNIEFIDINFSYPNNVQALKGVNGSINGGEKVGFVGVSGSGKTTLLNLIPRFFHLSKGKIIIDDQNINEVRLGSLRNKISLVSQDIILFDDTVLKNLTYGYEKASKEDILQACKNSASQEFIEKLPEKYETIIGENGVRLSGGQKQRISIARAILKNAPIILLDEATSSLDSESEKVIHDAIENLTKNKTTIIIAHRLATIKNCNKIFLFDKGKIIDSGTHNELIDRSKIYSSLYEKQILN
jgi:subfamily B ATP-binding cassette protein MsbA